MPKTPRSESDISAVKEIICDAALAIILTDGFNALSMRKIGTRTSMTAANIYNYFSNKDEIYLSIQQRGFEILHKRFAEINTRQADPLSSIQEMVNAYIDFGIKNPDLYEVMFTRNTPKYTDYIGTKTETTAKLEKDTALLLIDEATKLIRTFISRNPEINLDDIRYRVIQAWTALHGVVSLYNSRVLQEVDPDTDQIFKKISADLFLPVLMQQHAP